MTVRGWENIPRNKLMVTVLYAEERKLLLEELQTSRERRPSRVVADDAAKARSIRTRWAYCSVHSVSLLRHGQHGHLRPRPCSDAPTTLTYAGTLQSFVCQWAGAAPS